MAAGSSTVYGAAVEAIAKAFALLADGAAHEAT